MSVEGNYYPKFQERLITYLERKGKKYTQQDFADDLGINRSTVNRWINHGTRPGDTETIVRIAALFNLNEMECQYLIDKADYETTFKNVSADNEENQQIQDAIKIIKRNSGKSTEGDDTIQHEEETDTRRPFLLTLNYHMERNSLSAAELIEQAGINPDLLQDWLNGKSTPFPIHWPLLIHLAYTLRMKEPATTAFLRMGAGYYTVRDLQEKLAGCTLDTLPEELHTPMLDSEAELDKIRHIINAWLSHGDGDTTQNDSNDDTTDSKPLPVSSQQLDSEQGQVPSRSYTTEKIFQEEQQTEEEKDEEKQRIIVEMSSTNDDIAKNAAFIAAQKGWLHDGSLIGCDLTGANLQNKNYHNISLFSFGGTGIVGAILLAIIFPLIIPLGFLYALIHFVYLVYVILKPKRVVKLDKAILRDVNFTKSNLSYVSSIRSDVCGTNFTEAKLRGAKFQGATYDQHTIWPEGFDPDAAGAVKVDTP